MYTREPVSLDLHNWILQLCGLLTFFFPLSPRQQLNYFSRGIVTIEALIKPRAVVIIITNDDPQGFFLHMGKKIITRLLFSYIYIRLAVVHVHLIKRTKNCCLV